MTATNERRLTVEEALNNVHNAHALFDKLNHEAADAKATANRLYVEMRNAQTALDKARDDLEAVLPNRQDKLDGRKSIE